MDERRANIDLVFRNGLKGYEVLPPPEVWNNIRPVVRRKQRPLIILRAAAAVAVLLSMSFLVYRLSIQINSIPFDNIITLAEESYRPFPVPLPVRESEPQTVTTALMPLIEQVYTPEPTAETTVLSGSNLYTLSDVFYPAGSDILSLYETDPARSGLRKLFKPEDNEIQAEDRADLFYPVTEPKQKTEKWTIAALVSPTYHTNFYLGNDEITSQLISYEQPVFSYAGGVAFAYRVNKRISVQSGLYYSSFGQELSGITAFGGFTPYDYAKGDRNFEVLTSTGTFYTNNTDIFLIDTRSDNRITTRYTRDYFDPAKANLQYIDNSLRQNFSYLEFPVIFRYKLIDRTIDFNVVGGLSSNFLVNNSVYAAIDGGRYQVGKTEGMNFLTFSSSVGMGMEYNFSGNLSLNLEPTLRYYLNPFNQTPGLRIHPYSFGIFSGISYRF
ncbi:MAG TPA: hypothetical protein DDW27_07935 [Bacteroidales bacterium]|nr:hypothetical protein [Bacteroidales bacterium]